MIDGDGVYLKVFNKHVTLCVRDYVGFIGSYEKKVERLRQIKADRKVHWKQWEHYNEYYALGEDIRAFESAKQYLFGRYGLELHAKYFDVDVEKVKRFRREVEEMAKTGKVVGVKAKFF